MSDCYSSTVLINGSGGTENLNFYDTLSDLYNNAFALKYNHDGSVGYRYLVRDCDSEEGYKILEEYSNPGHVKEDEWNVVNVRIRMLNGHVDECENQSKGRKMKLFFYVNGYLKFVSKELPAFDFRKLDDMKERQEGVPYNISLGGGTQGLAESIWTKYKQMFPRGLPLEKNFAGSFIGDIRSFKIYSCPLEYNQIKNNYRYERNLKNGKER